LRSNSALRMSISIESSPTLRCASRNDMSSTATGRDFSPSRPAARNSSRQPAILPAGWPTAGETFEEPVSSRSTVSRILEDTRERYRRWCERRLDGYDIVYVFCDAIYLKSTKLTGKRT